MQLLDTDLAYFPENYEKARRTFLELCEDLPADAVRGRWAVPSSTDEELFVDHVFLPATKQPKQLFVILSGVHGLEGYAGSAIQAMFLKEILPTMDRSSSSFFIVHSLNPFGFKHHRRGTENHINLNRNCSSKDELFQFKNPQSLAFAKQFIPVAPVSSTTCQLLQRQSLRDGKIYFEDVWSDEFIKGVGIGQYEDPKGLEFGGHQPEPQIKELIKALQLHVPGHQDIILLDLHTGLGFRGRLHLLTGDVEGSVDESLFSELFDPKADHSVYDFTSSDADGFYKTLGATNNLFPELATLGQRVCALTMEFGTIGHDQAGQLESLNQWMLEHQGLFYGYATKELETQIKQNYLQKFYPSDPAWKKTILATSREFLHRTLRRANRLA